MNLTLEDKVKTDIGKYFINLEFSFPAAFYYSGKFVEGMEKQLRELSFKEEAVQSASLLEIFRRGVMSEFRHVDQQFVYRAKMQGKVYMGLAVQEVLSRTVEDPLKDKLKLSGKQQGLVIKQYRDIVFTLLHLIMDIYKIPKEIMMAYRFKPELKMAYLLKPENAGTVVLN